MSYCYLQEQNLVNIKFYAQEKALEFSKKSIENENDVKVKPTFEIVTISELLNTIEYK